MVDANNTMRFRYTHIIYIILLCIMYNVIYYISILSHIILLQLRCIGMTNRDDRSVVMTVQGGIGGLLYLSPILHTHRPWDGFLTVDFRLAHTHTPTCAYLCMYNYLLLLYPPQRRTRAELRTAHIHTPLVIIGRETL